MNLDGLLANPLFAAGMGLLASSGPSLTPVNPWGGAYTGLLQAGKYRALQQKQAQEQQALQIQQQAMAANIAKQRAQMVEAQRKAAAEQELRDALASGDAKRIQDALVAADPGQAAAAMFKTPSYRPIDEQIRLEQEKARLNQQSGGLTPYQAESLALRESMATQNADLRKLTLDAQMEARAAAAEERRLAREERQEAATDRAVTAFANELQQNKIPQLSASIQSLNDKLTTIAKGGKQVPGVGYAKNLPLANWFLSEAGKNTKSEIQAVANDLLNMYSGLAVTLPEAERRQLEMMTSAYFSEDDFRNAWPRVVSRFNEIVGNAKAGVSESVRRQYQSRPGAMNLAPLRPAFAPAPKPATAPVRILNIRRKGE